MLNSLQLIYGIYFVVVVNCHFSQIDDLAAVWHGLKDFIPTFTVCSLQCSAFRLFILHLQKH